MAIPVSVFVAIGALLAIPVESLRAQVGAPASTWSARVERALALQDDNEKAAALLALVKDALGNRDVRRSGISHPDQIHPADNAPWPAINIDLHLNRKRPFYVDPKVPNLSTQRGYFFAAAGIPYIVLGPAAIDSRGPVLTRMWAAHEDFHATHHVRPTSSMADRELETWVSDFVTFFHEVHQFRLQWRPMLTYYEGATASARTAAIQRLSDYYRDPPGERGALPDGVDPKAVMRLQVMQWFAGQRADPEARSLQFIADLDAALLKIRRGGRW